MFRILLRKFTTACVLTVVCGTGFAQNAGTNEKSNPEAGGILGLEAIEGEFAFFDAANDQVRNMPNPPGQDPVFFYLSKEEYPAEDGHLDVMLWLDAGTSSISGELLVEMVDSMNGVIFSQSIGSLPGRQLFFSVPFSEELLGKSGRLRLTWKREGGDAAHAERSFRIRKPEEVATSGSIAIRISNSDKVTLSSVPVTVGVPFPRGALKDVSNLRLVTASGGEIPMQARVTAKWSRFGFIKWVLLDFEASLQGRAAEFALEYGTTIQREDHPAMRVSSGGASFPEILGDNLRIREEGLSVGGGTAVLLKQDALFGGFVEHEDGRRFSMGGGDMMFEVEETGPVKTVVRATGSYQTAPGGESFCQYNTRYYIYKNSPLMRIMHSWIFTGNGNRDRIRDMGWRFSFVQPAEAGEFQSAANGSAAWVKGDNLLQYAHDHYEITTQGGASMRGKRAPGMMRGVFEKDQVVFGSKDFWQNYPSELSMEESAMTFHNWPRNGRSSSDPVDASNAFLLKFAHSGEVLDFRLPDEFLEGAIPELSSQGKGGERHWSSDRESANAQGIARTEEMWIFAGGKEADTAKVMHALNAENLRAVVDPAWLSASGAFYEIHPKDVDNYAEHEKVYEEMALAPGRWTERLGTYGMWIFGDAIFEPRLEEGSAGLFRTFRKAHQGWPYSWVPYVRSGDSRLFKLADNATRHMIDANFCHYVSPDVKASVEGAKGGYYRRQGWWFRSMVPWTGWRGPVSRSYLADCDYLWHAYYVTGYRRPMDIALLWGKLAKEEPNLAPPESRTGPINRDGELRRMSFTMLKSFTEMYQATFDPWYMAGMHAIADMHLTENRKVEWEEQEEERVGHFWEPGDREYHRFTGRSEYEPYFANASKFWANYRGSPWSDLNPPMIESTSYAYDLTGDKIFAQRAAYYLDYAKTSVWTRDEAPHLKGILTNDIQLSRTSVFIGYYLSQFPLALALFDRMGYEPDPLAESFYQMGNMAEAKSLGKGLYTYTYPVIRVQKKKAGPLRLLLQLQRGRGELTYEISGASPGLELNGQVPADNPNWVEIPADWPPGVYQIRVSAKLRLKPTDIKFSLTSFPGLKIPLSPPGTPEVMVVPAVGVGYAAQKSQYWFYVPAGVSSFTIDFYVNPPNKQARRLSVWGPDGDLAWDWQKVVRGVSARQIVNAKIQVRPEQQGKLWRITVPGGSNGFRLPPEIPAAVSVDGDRWFQ